MAFVERALRYVVVQCIWMYMGCDRSIRLTGCTYDAKVLIHLIPRNIGKPYSIEPVG